MPSLLGKWGTSEYGVYVMWRPTRRRRPGLGRARHRLCGLRSHFPEELLIPTVTRCREAGEDGTVVPT